MNITLAGLQAREAAALKFFINLAMKGWIPNTVALLPGLALPAADLYIIDLAGCGLEQWSVKTEVKLLALLGGRSALLLTAPNSKSWHDRKHGSARQRLVCLAKPYGKEAMRAVLADLVLGMPSKIEQALVPVAAAPESAQAPLMSWASLQSLRAMFPDLYKQALLSRLLDLLAMGGPCELRLSLHHALVMHPEQGWVAHNAEPVMLARWAQHGGAVASMSVRELDSVEALQRVTRSGSVRTSLDTFLWLMAESSMKLEMPSLHQDAELKLSRMPSFTRIPGASSLYLQLASICVRLPQTLSSLRAIFPRHDHRDIARFMLLATISGHGQLSLLPVQVPALGQSPSAVKLSHKPVAVTSGFFRAMLQKLF